jgi:hypothetical protein
MIESCESGGLAFGARFAGPNRGLWRANFLGDFSKGPSGECLLQRLLRISEDVGQSTLDFASYTATLVRLLWMHSESRCGLHRTIDFAERNLLCSSRNPRAGACSFLRHDETRALELRKDPADDYGIRIHATSEGLRSDTAGTVPGEDCKDMHRESEATTGHFFDPV